MRHGAGRLLAFLNRQKACLHHLGQHAVGALSCHGRVGGRRIPGGRLQEAREQGGFNDGHVARRLGEEPSRRRLDTVRSGAEVHPVEVQLQDVAFAEAHLQPQRQHQFLELASPCALGAQEQVLGELLRQRRAALRDPPLAQVGEGRTHHAGGIEPPVLEEASVLRGNYRIDEMAREKIDRHIGIAGPALAQQRAVPGQNPHDWRLLLEAQSHGVGDARRVVDEGYGGDDEERRPEIEDRQGAEPDLPGHAPQQPALARACGGRRLGPWGMVKAHRLGAVPGTPIRAHGRHRRRAEPTLPTPALRSG